MLSSEVGPYWVMEQIGESRLGPVFKGIHKRKDEEVAITVVRAELLADPAAKERFLAHARALATISHRNLVQVLACLEENGEVFLLIQLVAGETLAERIQREGGLPVAAACDVVLRVLDALQCLHGAKVIHGELEPGQVIVAPDGVVKVQGFGFTGFPGEGAASGAASAVPEQSTAAEPAYTDIHAVGAILAATLSGQLEICLGGGADGSKALLASLPAGVPEPVRQVLEKALATDAKLRYTDVRAFAHELKKARKGVGTSLQPRGAQSSWAALFLLVVAPVLYAVIFYETGAKDPQETIPVAAPRQTFSAAAPARAPKSVPAAPVAEKERIKPAASGAAAALRQPLPNRSSSTGQSTASKGSASPARKAAAARHHKKRNRHQARHRTRSAQQEGIATVAPAASQSVAAEPWRIRK